MGYGQAGDFGKTSDFGQMGVVQQMWAALEQASTWLVAAPS